MEDTNHGTKRKYARTDGDTASNDKKQRAWVFTLNNPSETLLKREGMDDALALPSAAIRYGIWQVERGESGTTHLQGYLEFSKPVRLSHCRKVIPGAHFESRRGTRDQAIAYCEKEDTRIDGPFEHGRRDTGGQGKRSDLIAVKEAIDAGATEKDIANEHFSTWCRNYRAFERYRHLTSTQRDWKTIVELRYGTPGTGKSRTAMDLYPGAYWKPRGLWWDGYEGQEVVILDEFFGWLTWDALLKICDRYPLNVETKGGTVAFTARRLVITTNADPRRWYGVRCPFEAFARRVDRWILHLKSGPDPDDFTMRDFPDCETMMRATDTTFVHGRDIDARFD